MYCMIILDAGEIRDYIKVLRKLDTNKIKDRREADSRLTPHIPVRV